MRFPLTHGACALLLVICLSFSCFLPAAAGEAAPAALDPIAFTDCLPQTMAAGEHVSFAGAWRPVKGQLSAAALTGTTVLDYYTGTVLAAGPDTADGSYRPSNGRFTLPAEGAVGAMFCAPQDGTLSLSFSALCGVRSLQTSSAAQEKMTVGGVVYYAYYDKMIRQSSTTPKAAAIFPGSRAAAGIVMMPPPKRCARPGQSRLRSRWPIPQPRSLTALP